MEIEGDAGARYLRHGGEGIQLSEEQIKVLSEKIPAEGWGYLTRKVRPALSEKERVILEKWFKDKADLSTVCLKRPPNPPKTVKPKH